MNPRLSLALLLFCAAAVTHAESTVENCVTDFYPGACQECAVGYQLDFQLRKCFIPCDSSLTLYQGKCVRPDQFNTGCARGWWQWPAGNFQCAGCFGENILVLNGNSAMCQPLDTYLKQTKPKWQKTVCTTKRFLQAEFE